MSPRRKRRRAPAREPAQTNLGRIEEAQREFLMARPAAPRAGRDIPELPRPVLGPPSLGSAAKVAAALMQLRHAEQLQTAAGDRVRIIAVQARGATSLAAPEAMAQAEVDLQAAHQCTVAARVRVNAVKQEVTQQRIARGLNPDVGRLLRQLDLADDPRLVPFGIVPKIGTRSLPTRAPAAPVARPRTIADVPIDVLVDKILRRNGEGPGK